MTTTVYRLEGDTDQLTASVKDAAEAFGDLQDQAARAEREVKRVENASKPAATSTANLAGAAGKVREGFKGIAAEGIGGPLGQIASFGADAAGELGGLGMAAAGTAIAIGVLAVAGVKLWGQLDVLATAADAANDRLDELAGSGGSSWEAETAIRGWKDAQLELEASTSRLTVELAEELLPTFTALVPSIVGVIDAGAPLVEWTGSMVTGFRDMREELLPLIRGMLLITSGGLTEATGVGEWMASIGHLEHQVITTTDSIEKMTAADREQLVALGMLVDEEAELAELEKQAQEDIKAGAAEQERQRKAAEEGAKRRAAEAAAAADLAKLVVSASEDQLTAQEKIRAKYDEQLETIARLEKASRDHVAAEAARAESYSRLQRDLAAADKADADKAADKKKKEDDDKKKEEIKSAKQISDAHKELTKSTISAIDDGAAALQGMVKEGSAAYTALFLARQGAAAASTVVNTAEAISAALTIPPPMGEAIAVERGLVGAAQLAAIVGASIQGLKKNHAGSSGIAPDESLRLVLNSEAVLNPAATAAMGGHAGVARFNAGGGSGQGDGRVAVLQWRNRSFSGPIAEFAKTPGSPLYLLGRQGRRTGQRDRSTRTRALTTG